MGSGLIPAALFVCLGKPRDHCSPESNAPCGECIDEMHVEKLAAQKRGEVRRDSERNTDLLNMKLLDSQRDKMDEILLAHAPQPAEESEDG